MDTFPLALTFLTVLPWPRLRLAGPEELARSLFWFPWVGALLGLLYGGAALAFSHLWRAPVAAAVLLALPVLLTRGLHLDGLADTLDGLGGGKDPASRLAVMKDSRLGSFGALGLVVVLLLKYALFGDALEHGALKGLILSPVLSRWGMVCLAFLSPYARTEGGLGQAMTEGITPRTFWGATFSALGLSLVLLSVRGAFLLAATGLVVVGLSRVFRRKLGGITGDVLGATNELLEVLVLAGALLGRG